MATREERICRGCASPKISIRSKHSLRTVPIRRRESDLPGSTRKPYHPPQLGGGVENGADDLVVTGAPAKIVSSNHPALFKRMVRPGRRRTVRT